MNTANQTEQPDRYLHIMEVQKKEKQWLKELVKEQCPAIVDKRWHEAVPRKVTLPRPLTEQEVQEVTCVLSGHSHPGWRSNTGTVYSDKYKCGLRARTVLLIGNFTNALSIAEILESELPVKVVFIPHAQLVTNVWGLGRYYLSLKMKVLFK